jgi:rod shape-determining protein MreC
MNFSGTEFTNKKKKVWLKVLLGLAILLGLVFALSVFSSQIKNSFFILSSPLQKNFLDAGKSSGNWLGSLLSATSLQRENEELKKENQNLLSKISTLQSIQEGNQALSTISATCQNQNFSTIMAGVTGLVANEDMLTINKGLDDGIKEGMPVIDQYNVLYGKILKVYKNFSQVMLISNKNSIINVETQQNNVEIKTEPGTDGENSETKTVEAQTKSAVNGIVKGNGGLSIYLDLVPVDDQISSGEILITSSLEQIFPKNILVGKITEIKKNDQKPFQQAKINPFFDLDNIENLFIITNYKQ